MSMKYELFRKTPDTSLTWTETFEDAASGKPGEYLIWDLSEHRCIEELEESA
jgi:hypothetical protein